jgi:hypothetical protein
MQILITHGSLARTRVLRFNRWQLGAALFGLIVLLTLLSGTVYNLVFLKAAREGWPVVSQLVRFVVRDEFAQRDRFMRENLDAMAQKVGEVQAKLIKLEAMGERVSTAVGVKPDELKIVPKARSCLSSPARLRRSNRSTAPSARSTSRLTSAPMSSPCSSRACSNRGSRR